MRTLLKNGRVVNAFTGELGQADVLIGGDMILGVGSYDDCEADKVSDIAGKTVCAGFIDGHIHIESTMLLPAELARVCVPHGTTSIIADPHEIANVCGSEGIDFMLKQSENIPLTVYFMLPSCVPATKFDESGAKLAACDLRAFYTHKRVLGLGEVMDYHGVIAREHSVMKKIEDAAQLGKLINGHAPLLTGKELDSYIAAGISDDHECSSFEEAVERIRKGQHVMIRQGTAARNLDALLKLFDAPYSRRCLLVTDDKHPADLISQGHIDAIIRQAVANGQSVITGIQMATIQAAEYYGLRKLGAVAAGYTADILVLDDLDSVKVRDVYRHGKKIVSAGRVIDFTAAPIGDNIKNVVYHSFHLDELHADMFHIAPKSKQCRVIKLIPKQLLTREWIADIDWQKNNGIDIERDILKLAVIERHLHTGHIGLGFISGTGLKKGAIASSVSHDSHNLIVIGTNDDDMAIVANRIRHMGGGCAVAADGDIIAEMPLPVAGLMSILSAAEVSYQNNQVRKAAHSLGVPENVSPFMNMAFLSLPVIPDIKMTTLGLINVNSHQPVLLYVN